MPSIRPHGLVFGLAASIAAAGIRELVRVRPGPTQIIDWAEVERLAAHRLPSEQQPSRPERAEMDRIYEQMLEELRPGLMEVLGEASVAFEFPRLQTLTRQQWLELNVDIMRHTMEPLMESAQALPNTGVMVAGRMVADRYLSFILTWLAGRVLGQYDALLLGRTTVDGTEGLYVVEPNLVAFATTAHLPLDSVRRFVVLHEMAHAWQYQGHPWLVERTNSLLGELIELSKQRTLLDIASIPTRARQITGELQAMMTVIEGYGNLTMDLAGAKLLPDHQALEEAHHKRGQRSPLDRLIEMATGMAQKREQYVRGEKFCRRVYDAKGMAFLNRVWESAEMLPGSDELDNPERWIARVGDAKAPAPVEEAVADPQSKAKRVTRPKPRPTEVAAPRRRPRIVEETRPIAESKEPGE